MFKNYRLPLILGLLLTTLLFYTLSKTPKLNSSSPEDGALGVDLNSDITLTFNKALNPQKFEIKSTPLETFHVTSEGNTITLTHDKSFYQNTTYNLEFYYNRQKVGRLSFTTQKSESNPRDLQIIEDEMQRDYPLREKTPYSRPTFQVVYIAPLTLQIELYEKNLNQAAIAQEVSAWMSHHQVDPTTHKLVFKEPTPPSPTTYR